MFDYDLYNQRKKLLFLFQVDGEACRLLPSIINLKLLNKATMLAKRRSSSKPQQDVKLERLKLPVMKIKMSDYERYHHDKDMLKKSAITWIMEPLDLDATTDLESLRKILAKDYNMDTCCFLDCKYRCIEFPFQPFTGFFSRLRQLLQRKFLKMIYLSSNNVIFKCLSSSFSFLN